MNPSPVLTAYRDYMDGAARERAALAEDLTLAGKAAAPYRRKPGAFNRLKAMFNFSSVGPAMLRQETKASATITFHDQTVAERSNRVADRLITDHLQKTNPQQAGVIDAANAKILSLTQDQRIQEDTLKEMYSALDQMKNARGWADTAQFNEFLFGIAMSFMSSAAFFNIPSFALTLHASGKLENAQKSVETLDGMLESNQSSVGKHDKLIIESTKLDQVSWNTRGQLLAAIPIAGALINLKNGFELGTSIKTADELISKMTDVAMNIETNRIATILKLEKEQKNFNTLRLAYLNKHQADMGLDARDMFDFKAALAPQGAQATAPARNQTAPQTRTNHVLENLRMKLLQEADASPAPAKALGAYRPGLQT